MSRIVRIRLAMPMLLLLAALAACSGRSEAPPPSAVHARLLPGGTAIEVRVTGLAPSTQVAAIELVGPAGRRVPAESRHTVRGIAGSSDSPGVGIGAYGGSESGINPVLSLSLPLFDWSWLHADERRKRAVVARIPLPEGYRETRETWHVEVELIDAAGASMTRTAAGP